jgi:hypothetical protein
VFTVVRGHRRRSDKIRALAREGEKDGLTIVENREEARAGAGGWVRHAASTPTQAVRDPRGSGDSGGGGAVQGWSSGDA